MCWAGGPSHEACAPQLGGFNEGPADVLGWGWGSGVEQVVLAFVLQ